MRQCLILLLMVVIAGASNYIVNGDFEQPLSNGWTQYSSDGYGSITRSVNYDPDPDYEARAYRQGSGGYGGGYEKLYQTIDITMPLSYIDFSAALKLYAWDNGNSWCGAAGVLYYRDDNNGVLGVTRICRYSGGCPWTNSPTSHLIYVSDSSWHTYSFNIEDELQNLSGVDPAEVAKITVAILDTAYNC